MVQRSSFYWVFSFSKKALGETISIFLILFKLCSLSPVTNRSISPFKAQDKTIRSSLSIILMSGKEDGIIRSSNLGDRFLGWVEHEVNDFRILQHLCN